MSPTNNDPRRNPFSVNLEPIAAIAELPAVLSQRAHVRKSRVHPSEKRRRGRMVTITFADPTIPDRLRQLANERGLLTAAGQANVSALIEPWILEKLKG